MTLLHFLCNLRFGNNVQAVLELIGGGTVNMQNSSGDTALHVAAARVSHGLDFVRWLLENGADCSIRNK